MSEWQAPETAEAAIRGLCPQCGAGGLFSGVTRFADKCARCGLDYSRFNVGDGPAAFLILVIGGLITIGAVVLEVKAEPPFWVHILVWIPLTAILTLASLRIGKATLLILEFKNSAREGRLSK
jgi:uncharacterized protein (DUF983 family)